MTKIVAISDTHGQHNRLIVPKCDILIHAGDFTMGGTTREVYLFLDWFSKQPAEHKIFIAGNHDKILEKFVSNRSEAADTFFRNVRDKNLTYLYNSGVEVKGLKIWGTPFTRYFFDWAFNGLDYPPGDNNIYHGGPGRYAVPDDIHPLLDDIFKLCPLEPDILITHGPPYRTLDENLEGDPCGSRAQLRALGTIKPKMNIFGHIHEARGYQQGKLIGPDGSPIFSTEFHNVCSLDRDYTTIRQPIEIEIG